MKEIKGLSERLDSLQQRLRIARQLIQDQIDMSQVRWGAEISYEIVGCFLHFRGGSKESRVYRECSRWHPFLKP